MKLLVLLSCYNGERYLREQLDSLLSQTLSGVEIFVRDDGSSDGTVRILEEYAGKGLLRWTTGENIGASRSFWQLLQNCGRADYYAFCDQDDIWDPDKLITAVQTLEGKNKTGPAMYCSDVRVTDKEGRVLSKQMARPCPANYEHALFRNLAPGCTYVFNRAAKELLCEYDADVLGIEFHDWTAYQIISCFGSVVFDSTPHMSYRQHGGNAVGAAYGSNLELLSKVRGFQNGPARSRRARQALRMLTAYGNRMSPMNRMLTERYAHYQTDSVKKRQLLQDRRLKLGRAESLLFNLAVLFNRL